MSCEKNRGAFVAHVAGSGSPAAQAFGGPDESGAAIETIFDTARGQAATGSAPQQKIAEAKTRMLFEWMRRSGFKPPTHSASGLPKADAQFGYAAMYDTLVSLRDGKPLPSLAAQIVESFGQTRALTALRVDQALARLRCGSCGRFAPASSSGRPPHLCPNTTTPEKLQRALMRRLGVPASAYPPNDLARLLEEVRKDGVIMRHPITGEAVQANLDSLPLAITQGFVPATWGGEATLVEVSHGRLAPVLNAAGLTLVKPPASAVEAAAAASGASLPAGMPMISPAGLVATAHTVTAPEDGIPTVSGGSAYWSNRFIGTEFRKGKGQIVQVAGRTYTVGERSHDTNDWGRARLDGIVPPPPTKPPFDGIAVGRTLVAATEYLRTGAAVKRLDGVVEVYDAAGAFVSIYDPATRTAGDVDGTTNASAAQMAAVMAARMLDPQSDLDRCLAKDIEGLRAGVVTPLAVSDGAYLTFKAEMEAGRTLTLGGTLAAAQCPRCGKFMGVEGCRGAHAGDAPAVASVAAPVAEAPATPAPAAPSSVTVQVDAPQVTIESPAVTVQVDAPQVAVAAPAVTIEPPQVTVQVDAPQVTLNVDAPQVAVAPPQVTVQVDADAIASRLAARVPAVAPSGPDGAAAPLVAPVVAPLHERVITVLDRMLDRLDGMDRLSAEPARSEPGSAKPPRTPKPRADRPVPTPAGMTEQERIASALRMPRPDRELTAIDRKILSSDFAALDEDIPLVKTDYVMNEKERMVMQRMVSVRTMGMKMGRVNETRSFGIYGPPGTGKNELARQLAASLITVDADGNERQGVHFEQVEFDRDMDIGALIGTTALENGTTVARLGPVGLAAVQGSVICLNEVVRNPKALTAFQSMLEEGEIRLKTPEAGIIKIPIHPATTFVTTWNPGLEGDSDRPAEAPRSRMISMELPPPTPTEQAARVKSFFSKAPKEIQPHSAEINAAISFFTQVRSGIHKGSIQQRGRGSKAVPGPRDLNFFVLAGKTDGWMAALEQMRVFCDQNVEDRDKDWKFIQEQFAINFGHDGRAHSRPAPARA